MIDQTPRGGHYYLCFLTEETEFSNVFSSLVKCLAHLKHLCVSRACTHHLTSVLYSPHSFLPLASNYAIALMVNNETEEQVSLPCPASPHPHEKWYFGHHLQSLLARCNSHACLMKQISTLFNQRTPRDHSSVAKHCFSFSANIYRVLIMCRHQAERAAFILSACPTRSVLLSLIYKWGKQRLRKCNHSLKITQLGFKCRSIHLQLPTGFSHFKSTCLHQLLSFFTVFPVTTSQPDIPNSLSIKDDQILCQTNLGLTRFAIFKPQSLGQVT